MKQPILALAIAILLSMSAYASDLPGTWRGYVTLGGSQAPDGTFVQAFIGGSAVATVRVGITPLGDTLPVGYYIINVPGASGDSVTFKVNGLTITGANTTAQQWSFGLHPVGDSPYFNLSATKSADGASCTFSAGCSGGYCCSTATNCNGDCTGTCQASACSSGGSGSSSPGGGGSSAGAVSETSSLASIAAGQTGSFSFTNDAFGIYQVQVEAASAVSSPALTIQETSRPSAADFVIGSTEGSVYKYLEILKANIQTDQVGKVTIKFKVPKSWMTGTGTDPSTMQLGRLEGTSWNKLPTTKTSEDSEYYYYEASSPGLSKFAIFGLKKTASPATGQAVVEQPPAPPAAQPPASQPAAPEAKATPAKGIVQAIVLIFVLLGLSIALVTFVLKRPKSPVKKVELPNEIESLEKQAFRKH